MRSTLFLLPALASAYQLSSFLPSSTRRAAVSMQEAMEATVEPVSAEAEAPMDMAISRTHTCLYLLPKDYTHYMPPPAVARAPDLRLSAVFHP